MRYPAFMATTLYIHTKIPIHGTTTQFSASRHFQLNASLAHWHWPELELW